MDKTAEDRLRAQLGIGPVRATEHSLLNVLRAVGAEHVKMGREGKEYVAPWTWKRFFRNCWRVMRFKKWESRVSHYQSVVLMWCQGPTEEEATELIEDYRPAGVAIELKKRYP